MKYKLIIFDLDGTILDTLADLADSLNYALSSGGFPERSIDEVRRFVGNGIGKLVERGLPEGSDRATVERVLATFKAYYGDHCADKTAPYEGILPLLAELKEKGVKLAVVSNKADFAVQSLCAQYFGGLFDMAVGEREGICRKPAPDSVNEVIARLGVSKEVSLYVGDSEVDVQTAKNAEIDCIAVSWGFRDAELLCQSGAKQIVSTVEQLKQLL